LQYISTRGQAQPKNFAQLLLSGAAPDGGLYMPETWPQFSAEEISALGDKPFAEVAAELLQPFAGEAIPAEKLKRACAQAYAGFRDKEVCPLVELAPNLYMAELFHGPTFAFKDIAMQLLARLIDDELAIRNEKATIICATSGDTGAAAVGAFKDSRAVRVVILFPHNRISDVQRKQITATGARNALSIGIEGNFDDAQAIVKDLFADPKFSADARLASVNSINWARIAAQVTYYFTSALKLASLKRPVSFCVPTGNFGDIFAGYAAKKMGLPLSRLIIATNQNDILARTLSSSVYEVERVTQTSSPSMDIQVSSNFERLLFEASNRDAALVIELMESLRREKRFTIPPETLKNMRGIFAAARASEAEVMNKIRDTHRRTGRFIDPHTAVALVAAGKAGRANETTVVLSTAHAAKFPNAVKDACGVAPPAPEGLAESIKRQENFTVLPPETAKVRAYLQRNL
jgi:threonine synthase